MSLLRNTPTTIVSGQGGHGYVQTATANSRVSLNSGVALPCREVFIVPSISCTSTVTIGIGSALASQGFNMIGGKTIGINSCQLPTSLRLPIDDVDKLWMFAREANSEVNFIYIR
jgi:hypothetical protein